MSSSPPTLPITIPHPINESQPSITTPAFRTFLTRISTSIRTGFSQRRPWSELVDPSSLTRPESMSSAVSRIRKNYSYFRVNYLTLLAGVLAVSLVTHPFSLFMLLTLLGAWLFLYLFRPSDQPLIILGRTFSDRETLVVLVLVTAVVVFLTSVGSLLISAVLIGGVIVSVHGAFRVPEDLFLDEQETAADTGFLSFLGGAATAAGPAVAVRI